MTYWSGGLVTPLSIDRASFGLDPLPPDEAPTNDGPDTEPVPADPPEDDPSKGHEPTTEDGDA